MAGGLAELTDDELREVISYRTLRNGGCYTRLDARGAAWTLALLATDQPDEHPGDTIDIARAVRRWFELIHPDVIVLEPLVITCAPHRATDELSAEIERLLVGVHDERSWHRVIVLPQGGAPATRVLLEHLAGRVFVAADEVERLLPDGSGGSHTHSLLRTIEADFVAFHSERRLRDAITAGRYVTACERAEDLLHLRLANDELVTWCDAGRKIVDDEPNWIAGLPAGDEATRRLRLDDKALGRLGAMTEIVGRLQRSESWRDALTAFVAATELLSLAWCEEVAKVNEAQLAGLGWKQIRPQLCFVMPEKDKSSSVKHKHSHSVRPEKARTAVDQARHAAICATERCATCPLASRRAGKRILAAGGADAARAARERLTRLVELRNDVVHVRKRQNLKVQLATALKADLPGLRECFAVGEPATLASLLTDAAVAATNRAPPNPLAVIDARIEALLG